MSVFEIASIGHDDHGRYYEVDDAVPIEGVTVNEHDGTVTIHGDDRLDSE